MTTLSKDNFSAVLRAARVLPILTVRDVTQAVRTAEALAAGGLTVMEITLRTEVAVAAIQAIRSQVPGVTIGAGTLLKRGDFARAEAAGAQFAVSPGLTDELAQDAKQSSLPFLPGVQTAAEVMRAVGHGFRELKFYPAKAAGGVDVLVDFSSIFPQIGWCPTGTKHQHGLFRPSPAPRSTRHHMCSSRACAPLAQARQSPARRPVSHSCQPCAPARMMSAPRYPEW